jgi:hypothetical protein
MSADFKSFESEFMSEIRNHRNRTFPDYKVESKRFVKPAAHSSWNWGHHGFNMDEEGRAVFGPGEDAITCLD